jgi:hypothetical protein
VLNTYNMPKIKNTKHRVLISNLPKGFELVDGELVKKAHGGLVTGDQHNYGLVTFNPHAGDSENDRDVDVRYSLSSVPRDAANIEAEGGETVLTDLTNDGNYGLYDITGPKHSKGGVPMFLPEQSFIFSDTEKMKMDKTELAEFGIESKKKMTPAKVSKKFDLNRYYGLLNSEYADKTQANSAELMLTKNSESLSKLAFGQELKKDFEEGVPVAAHPYLNSIGIDPMEFTAQVEQRQQGGQEQMGEMRYGGILRKAQVAGPAPCPEGQEWDDAVQACVLKESTSEQPNGPFAPQNQYTSSAYSEYENDDINDGTLPANPGQFGLTRPETPAVETPTYGAPTVERTNKKGMGARMEQGLDRFMDSPGVDKFAEIGSFGVAAANVGNQIALNTKGEQAKQDMLKMSMVDNSVGVVDYDPNALGYTGVQEGLINKTLQGQGPSGYNGYYGEDGMEIPKAQEGTETGYYDVMGNWYPIDKPLSTGTDFAMVNGFSATKEELDQFVIDQQAEFDRQTAELNGTPAKAEQLWESGKTYKGGSPEWNQWYMSDNAEQYRDDRYTAYKARRESKGLKSLDADAYHDIYLRGQKQINAIQQRYESDPTTLTDKKWDATQNDFYNEQIDLLNADIEAANTAGLAADPDYKAKPLYKGLSDSEVGDFQSGYIGGKFLQSNIGGTSKDLVDMIHKGVNDQTVNVGADTYNISPEDKWFGDTTVGQWEEKTIPTYNEKTEKCECEFEGQTFEMTPLNDGGCPPCPEKEQKILDDAEVPEEIAPTAKVPFIQDILKLRSIANRKRDLFLPWEPAERKVRYEDVLEDPTRIIAAANSDANAAMQAAGAFAGPQALGARTAAIQGQNARAIADQVGAVNQRNVATINRGNAVRGQFEDSYNQRSNASNKRVYDNTMKALQIGMDEQNFDNEQYIDQLGNTITNASHAYNDNSLRDYYGYNPLKGGDVYQKGSKAFKPVPEVDRFAHVDKAGEIAKRYRLATNSEPSKEMMNYLMGIESSKKSNSNETYAQRERRNEQGASRKKGGAMKAWASPFYTGKMGV